MWADITYPFPNFNSTAIEVWEWISNDGSHVHNGSVNYHYLSIPIPYGYLSMLGLKVIHVSKRGPRCYMFVDIIWKIPILSFHRFPVGQLTQFIAFVGSYKMRPQDAGSWKLIHMCLLWVWYFPFSLLQLLHNKANINAINEHGNTPLHYACFWNYEVIAEVRVAMKIMRLKIMK